MMNSTLTTSSFDSGDESDLPVTTGPRYFEDITPLETRKMLAQKVKERYPNFLPIICEPGDLNDESIRIHKRKFLCPSSMKIGEFVRVVRSRIDKLESSEAIYLFAGTKSSIPSNTMTVEDAYGKYASEEDGLLYIKFAKENCFGN